MTPINRETLRQLRRLGFTVEPKRDMLMLVLPTSVDNAGDVPDMDAVKDLLGALNYLYNERVSIKISEAGMSEEKAIKQAAQEVWGMECE